MRWDGEDELVTARPPKWVFHARCTSLPSFPPPLFTEPRNGSFEVLLDTPQELEPMRELTFQVEATGPSGELLATPFKAVVTEPVEKPEARKIREEAHAAGTGRKPPYDLRTITEENWASQTCWGSAEWTGVDAGCFNEPTQSSPLVLIINQDCELLADARETMLKRKLDERTIQHRMNNYTAHIAFHLWQMYQQVQKAKEQQALDDTLQLPDDEQLKGEINRVASTLINLMEH
jgi:hypothetical protein